MRKETKYFSTCMRCGKEFERDVYYKKTRIPSIGVKDKHGEYCNFSSGSVMLCAKCKSGLIYSIVCWWEGMV